MLLAVFFILDNNSKVLFPELGCLGFCHVKIVLKNSRIYYSVSKIRFYCQAVQYFLANRCNIEYNNFILIIFETYLVYRTWSMLCIFCATFSVRTALNSLLQCDMGSGNKNYFCIASPLFFSFCRFLCILCILREIYITMRPRLETQCIALIVFSF